MAALTQDIHCCSPSSHLLLLKLLKLQVLLLTFDSSDSKRQCFCLQHLWVVLLEYLNSNVNLILLSKMFPWRLCCGKRERKNNTIIITVINCGDKIWHKGDANALIQVLALTFSCCAPSGRLFGHSLGYSGHKSPRLL